MSDANIKRAPDPVLSDPDAEPSAIGPHWRRIVRPRKGSERTTIRVLREGMGKTQEEIARALETDQSEVSRIERRPDILVSTLRKYAAALGARCDVVFVFPDGRRAPIMEPEPGAEPPK